MGGGTGNGEVQLWDTETGRELCEPIVRDMDQDVSVHSYTSSDGRRLFAGLSGGHKQLSYISFDIPPSDQPMPAWLADLAEALGGFRLTGDNTLELLRVDQQNSILHNVAGNVSADHTDEWSAVVHWLLDYGKDAVVSPSSTLTIWAPVSRDSSPTTDAPVRMDLLVHSPLNPKSFHHLPTRSQNGSRDAELKRVCGWLSAKVV